jgi:hypothetical protein
VCLPWGAPTTSHHKNWQKAKNRASGNKPKVDEMEYKEVQDEKLQLEILNFAMLISSPPLPRYFDKNL